MAKAPEYVTLCMDAHAVAACVLLAKYRFWVCVCNCLCEVPQAQVRRV